MLERARDPRVERWLPWVLLAVMLTIAGWLVMWAGRDSSFFYDDWDYVLDRQPWTLESILRPHNEHLQAVSVVIYKVLFETVGLRDYWVYRLFLVLFNLATGALLFAYARKRIGPWAALGVVAPLVVMAGSWYNMFWAFMICFTAATAAGMAALLAFDRRTRRGDMAGTLFVCLSIAASSAGVTFLIGAAVEWILRDDRRKRWWVIAVPLVLYGLWRLIYDPGSSARLHNAPEIPFFVVDGYDDSVAAVVGLGFDFGVVLAVALAALVVREFVEGERWTPRLAAAVAMPLSFWALTALGRADMGIEADANRYLYVSGLLVAVVAVEVGRRYVWTGRAAFALCVLLLAGGVMNGNALEPSGDTFRDVSAGGRPAATAYDIAGYLNPGFAGGDPKSRAISVARYLEVAKDYGSMGYTEEELRTEDPQVRIRVDQALGWTLGAAVTQLPRTHPIGDTPPPLVDSVFGTVSERRGCRVFAADRGDAFLEVNLPPEGLIIRAGDTEVQVRLRRFAPIVPEAGIGVVAPQGTGGIELTADRSRQPWIVRLSGAGTYEACSSVPG